FVSCSGYTTEKLPPDVCGEFVANCNEKIIPCEFIEKRAYGYFLQRQNEEKGWTIVFRTRGELKSKITGVKVTMDEVGKNVKIEESKVFLKYVDRRY
nr:hypothetical protein [Pyrinomonadaceae bacterium]